LICAITTGETVLNKFTIHACNAMVILGLAGCSEARRDPCQLLTIADVQSVDNTVSASLWAGRDGARKDDEVCVFSTQDGYPRVMLFVWYDKDNDPKSLVNKGVANSDAMIIELPGIGSEAAGSFVDDELGLLAVKSAQGLVGVRVKKPALRDSADYNEIVHLAEKALSRNH
jgi:hypothetical protein